MPHLPTAYAGIGSRKTPIGILALMEILAFRLAERKPDRIWQDRNGALRTSPADCQSFGADGWPIAVYYGSQRFPISQHPLTEEDEP